MRLLIAFLALASFCLADTITFRDGHVAEGSYLGGDARNVRMAVGDHVETYSIADINNIVFGGETRVTSRDPEPRRDPDPRRDPPPQEPRRMRRDRDDGPVLSAGTVLTIRMIESVDSQRDSVGQTFRASLDEPLMDQNGDTLVPRGADVMVKLVDDQQSGKIEGRTVLTLDVISLEVNGRIVEIDTESLAQQSSSRGAQSGKVIGGTTALGAIIGAIAGGGKGAAIGAVSGAGVGTAAQVMTKGQRVRIPSETRLTFTLQQAVHL